VINCYAAYLPPEVLITDVGSELADAVPSLLLAITVTIKVIPASTATMS
jgi:hypothetical protein